MRPGSHAHDLIQLLAVCGEYPMSSLKLLGSLRSMWTLINKLESKQVFRLSDNCSTDSLRLLRVSGKTPNRTIRFNKDGLSILDSLHPEALSHYLDTYLGHRFPGNIQRVMRNHRVAEAVACFMRAGIEYRPYMLPQLQSTRILQEIPGWSRFYLARHVKRQTGDEFNKTMYSRMVGLVFYPGGHYTVYNTRDAVMRWKGQGEAKVAVSLDELARWNNGAQPGILGNFSALLFGNSPRIALDTLQETMKDTQRSRHFNRIYGHIHYIPLNGDGIRLLRMLTLPDWNEVMLDGLFPPEMRISGISNFDAQRGGQLYVSHLDSDIAKLLRVKQAMTEEDIEFLCFPWQAEFLHGIFGPDVRIRVVEMSFLEEVMGLK